MHFTTYQDQYGCELSSCHTVPTCQFSQQSRWLSALHPCWYAFALCVLFSFSILVYFYYTAHFRSIPFFFVLFVALTHSYNTPSWTTACHLRPSFLSFDVILFFFLFWHRLKTDLQVVWPSPPSNNNRHHHLYTVAINITLSFLHGVLSWIPIHRIMQLIWWLIGCLRGVIAWREGRSSKSWQPLVWMSQQRLKKWMMSRTKRTTKQGTCWIGKRTKHSVLNETWKTGRQRQELCIEQHHHGFNVTYLGNGSVGLGYIKNERNKAQFVPNKKENLLLSPRKFSSFCIVQAWRRASSLNHEPIEP